MLKSNTDDKVQLHFITALRTIGGPTAVEGLCLAAKMGSEEGRDAAIAAIEELATGGRIEDTEPPPPPDKIQSSWGSNTKLCYCML